MTMRHKDFAAIILSHGRADKVITYKTLRRDGYTGPIYILIDDQDDQAPRYYELYGEQVVQFNKEEYIRWVDGGDNFEDYKAVVYARNAVFDIARNLGLKTFIMLDDDYVHWRYMMEADYTAIVYELDIKSLDRTFDLLLDYYESIPAKSLAIAQGGDFLGGIQNRIDQSITQRRKAMNTFICSVDRPFEFYGKVNEDVSAYCRGGNTGELFITFPLVAIQQPPTQSNKGGLTDIYLEYGTYVKSFYTVMYQPSSVAINLMSSKYPRLHHVIKWENTVPYIIREQYKKA